RKNAFAFCDHSILTSIRSAGRLCCLIRVGLIFCHPCPAWLIRNLQESVEEEAPQESWDDDDSTLSIPPGTFAFNELYRTNLHSLEEQQVNLAHDIDKIKKDQEEEEDQGPLCPRLSMELVEAEEPEVFWYSLDILYSTYTAYLEFYYTCQAYTYAIFLYAEEHVRLTLDMDSRFLTMTVIGLHLVSRIGVIFPH
uniref:Olduvai domain-containing protein n=1 Tax=Callithrix jacchus TaxID=9483 RepID=A0A8I3WBE9_CALJA